MGAYEDKILFCIILKELVEKMNKTTELRELCRTYNYAINILGYIYEYHVGRIIREEESTQSERKIDK